MRRLIADTNGPVKLLNCGDRLARRINSPGEFRRKAPQKMVERISARAKLGFQAYVHMLRHACGYKLANDGTHTRTIQAYLGHKDIRHTVRYTELSPVRFRGLWRD